MDKKEQVANKLNEVFGETNIKLIAPAKFLAFVETVLVEQYEKLVDMVSKKETIGVERLRKEFDEQKALLTGLVAAVKAIHIPEPKDITIPEYPKILELKQPAWYREVNLDGLQKQLERVEKAIGDAAFNRTLDSVPFTVNSDRVIVPGVAGKVIRVYAMKLITSEKATIQWWDGLLPLEGSQTFVANGGYTESILPPGFLFATSPGNPLRITIEAENNGVAAGRVSYWVE